MFPAKLQSELLRQDLANEDELLLAIAGIKQVSIHSYPRGGPKKA